MGTTASFWMGRKKLKIFKVALIVCDGVLVESTDDTFPTDSASSDSEYVSNEESVNDTENDAQVDEL